MSARIDPVATLGAIAAALFFVVSAGCSEAHRATVEPLTLDDMIRLCGYDVACGFSPPGGEPGGCVEARLDASRALLSPERYEESERCALGADGCTAYWACFGFEVQPGAACTPGCSGNVNVICTGEAEIRVDCGVHGATCIPTADGTGASCGSGTCTGSSDECVGPTGRTICVSGVERQLTCEANSTCEEIVGCRAPTCDEPGGVDCSTMGATCVSGTCQIDEGAPCTGEAPSCLDADTQRFCLLGVERSLDCTSIGLERCINGYCTTSDALYEASP